MSPPQLDKVGELVCLISQGFLQALQSRQQHLLHLEPGGNVQSRRDYIVAGLTQVDVVVGVNRSAALLLAAQKLVGPGRNNLVYVHVSGGSGTGLKHIYRELVGKAPLNDLLCRLPDSLGNFLFEQAKFVVDPGDGSIQR